MNLINFKRDSAKPFVTRMNDFSLPYQAKLAAPFAVLGIRVLGEALTGIDYLPLGIATLAPQNRLADKVCEQLLAYIADPGFEFSLPYELNGTAYQRRVWKAIAKIPGGHTLTYSDIARRIDSGPRAVGAACGANRIPIVIPCHRVVAKNGLGGFMNSRSGAPLEIKRWLLKHESA